MMNAERYALPREIFFACCNLTQDRERDYLIHACNGDDDALAELADRTEAISRIARYDEVGLLTTDKGLVIGCENGGEYQVAIVRSR